MDQQHQQHQQQPDRPMHDPSYDVARMNEFHWREEDPIHRKWTMEHGIIAADTAWGHLNDMRGIIASAHIEAEVNEHLSDMFCRMSLELASVAIEQTTTINCRAHFMMIFANAFMQRIASFPGSPIPAGIEVDVMEQEEVRRLPQGVQDMIDLMARDYKTNKPHSSTLN